MPALDQLKNCQFLSRKVIAVDVRDAYARLYGARSLNVFGHELPPATVEIAGHRFPLSFYHEAEEILTASLGKDSPALAGVLNSKALLLMQLGRTQEAEKLFDRAIGMLRSGAGTETPSLAAVLHNLGNLYEITGRPNEGRQLHQQAAAMLAKIFGPGHAPFVPAATLPVWQDL